MSYTTAEANAYLAAIVDSSDDAIISKDLNGNVNSWNKGAERIFGYTDEEAIGKHISLIIPPDRLSDEDYILGKIRNGERIEHFESVRRAKNGRLVDLSITVSPIKNSQGKIVGASKVARDISERIHANTAVREAGRKKDEFLTNMSHELRTPMNAVIGITFLLSASKSLGEQDKKLVETLKFSADNLMDLINDLLDFAKIDNGSLELEQIPFKLTDVVQKAISIAGVKTQQKHLKLNVKYSPVLDREYIGDPLRLHQIIMNLLSNAVKFTDRGSVNIQLDGVLDEKTGMTHLSICVSDTGIGIARDKLEAIFEKFIQADASVTRRYGGTGLGLAITKALANKMGGEVTVKSDVGGGSTFVVTIPLKNTDNRVAPQEMAIVETKDEVKEHLNILLVEDYRPNSLVATLMLEQMGYSFEVADTGAEALQKFQCNTYDMILMNVQMPELDGLETTKIIRTQEAEKGLQRTPIVAMTAHVREQDKETCLSAGMDDFIPKPFEPKDLFEKVNRFVGQANKAGVASDSYKEQVAVT